MLVDDDATLLLQLLLPSDLLALFLFILLCVCDYGYGGAKFFFVCYCYCDDDNMMAMVQQTRVEAEAHKERGCLYLLVDAGVLLPLMIMSRTVPSTNTWIWLLYSCVIVRGAF